MNYNNIAGTVFSRLTAIKKVGRAKNGNAIWMCVCSCGKEVSVCVQNLKKGHTRSCGCLAEAERKTMHVTHGLSKTPVYRIWGLMIDRCENSRSPGYANYGGRGIRVCSSWRSSFEEFYRDMGMRPSEKHSIDRIDNQGNYEPRNCRWATKKEQARNKRSSRIITVNGVSACVSEWADKCGLKNATVHARLRAGWTAQEAISPIK